MIISFLYLIIFFCPKMFSKSWYVIQHSSMDGKLCLSTTLVCIEKSPQQLDSLLWTFAQTLQVYHFSLLRIGVSTGVSHPNTLVFGWVLFRLFKWNFVKCRGCILNGLNVNVMQQYAVRELRSHSNKPNKVEHLPV